MRIVWGSGTRTYPEGVSQGVLYPQDSPGVPWNGLVSVTETGDKDQEPKYFDGRKYHNRSISPSFSGVISAFTYPDEFEPYAGISGVFTGQLRKSFGFSYRTNNEIHLVYNVLVSPSKSSYSTLGETVDPVVFEWPFRALPVKIPGGKPSADLVVFLSQSSSSAVASLEDLIYGDDENDPRLPLPEEVIGIFESFTTLRITDNGDGTWTATAAGSIITVIDADSFSINWPSAISVDAGSFIVSSL